MYQTTTPDGYLIESVIETLDERMAQIGFLSNDRYEQTEDGKIVEEFEYFNPEYLARITHAYDDDTNITIRLYKNGEPTYVTNSLVFLELYLTIH